MSLPRLQQLVDLIQQFYNHAATPAEATQLWQQAEQLSQHWIDSWQRQAKFWLAQLSLPAQTSLPALLATRHAVLLSLYCHPQRWPEWQREQLLAGCWFVHLWNKNNLQAYSQLALSDEQQILIQDPWAGCVRLLQQTPFHRDNLRFFANCSRLRRGQPEWQQNAMSSLVVLTYRLAIAIQPVKGKPWPGIEQAVRLCWRTALSQGQRSVLKRLLIAAPAMHQLARLCTDHIGTVCLITDGEPTLRGHEFDLSMTLLSDEIKPITSRGFTLLPPRFCKDSRWWQPLIDEQDLAQEPVSTSTLNLTTLAQLNPNWGISRQLQWLERQPELLPYIRHAASAQTREQQQIQDLRHALAMLGTEQLPQILRLSWLQQQMEQQQGVLGPWFSHAAAHLATIIRVVGLKSAKLALVYSEADVVAVCLMLVAQRETPMAALQLSLTGSSQSPIADYCHRLLWQDHDFPSHCSQMLAAVSPRAVWTDAALKYRRELELPARVSQQQAAEVLLRFALLEFQQSFLGITTAPEQVQTAFRHAQQALDLPNYSLAEWRQLYCGESNACCPIQGNL